MADGQARLPRRAAAAGRLARDDPRAGAAGRRWSGFGWRCSSTAYSDDAARPGAARRGRSGACPRRWSGGCRSSSTALSAASATGSASRWRRTSPGCTPRSRPSPTRSGASTSTGWRCCAATRSGSTTCSSRCSRRWAGCCGWRSSMVLLMTRVHPVRSACSCCSPYRPWSRPPGGRASSGGSRSASHRTSGWPATCSSWAPPPRRARRCGSPATGRTWPPAPAREWRRRLRPMAAGPLGHRRLERPRLGGVRARLCRRRRVHGQRLDASAGPGRAGAGRRQPALAVRRPPPSVSSGSCAASGSTRRAG